MALHSIFDPRDVHPVDVIESVANDNRWSFERTTDDEIAISVAGQWADYHVSYSWLDEHEALHLACAFDMTVTRQRQSEITRLLSIINEQLLFGHFDLWESEGAVMFRHSLILPGGLEPTALQVERLLAASLESCEAYFQAFHFVIEGARSEDAMAAAIFETFGTA
ncbi:YbjN domain-containing protein [Notoacmeibacter sp. MSK16QG-6]|uniref:YbjN domain-containing protein n=1 Tax=Notoacmeibacter sp. MSK16QG-6 TaxID=2957982 RepID=UPI0020A1BDDE|nr:YbjN domain-containing protein [Notoacmeibacter sp. MSK16QG-6]MCP1199863.1 YbjN domain-containing protein [Notoacmeibacter sp. MSK16QG-6]